MKPDFWKKNRRYILLFAAAVFMVCVAVIFLSRWKKNGEETAGNQDPYSEIVHLPIQKVRAYCVDEDGNLYVSHSGERAIRKYTEDGKILAVYSAEETGADGGETACREGEEPRCLCLSGGQLYYILSWQLMRIDLETGMPERITELDLWACELAVQGRTAAVMYYLDGDSCDRDIGRQRVENYWCGGEQLGLLDLDTLEWNMLEFHYLVTVEAMGEQGFLIEGFDEKNGFYLAELAADGTMGERIAAGFQEKSYLAWDEERGMFHAAAYAYRTQCVSGTLERPKEAYRYAASRLSVQNGGVKYARGCLYLLNTADYEGEAGTITRLKPELFFRETEPLTAYRSNLAEEPDWLGYPVEVETMYAGELALKLLAGDGDFDFVVLDSGMAAAWNMKRVGAYYPLNSVLEEPLSKAFDGVREFARNGEDIWALPLAVNLQSLVYSERNLQKAGCSMEGINKMSELAEMAEQLYDSGLAGWCDIHAKEIGDLLFQDYVMQRRGSGKISFRTEEFYELLDTVPGYIRSRAFQYNTVSPEDAYPELYQEAYNRALAGGAGASEAANEAFAASREAYYQDILLQAVCLYQDASEYEKFIGKEQFSLRPIPGAGGAPAYTAWAGLVVVNPASERREQAARLAGQMAKQVFSDPKSFLSAERSVYPEDSFSEELYRACADARILEILPQEIYGAVYRKAFPEKLFEGDIAGTADRDEVIAELERTVNAYLFE